MRRHHPNLEHLNLCPADVLAYLTERAGIRRVRDGVPVLDRLARKGREAHGAVGDFQGRAMSSSADSLTAAPTPTVADRWRVAAPTDPSAAGAASCAVTFDRVERIACKPAWQPTAGTPTVSLAAPETTLNGKVEKAGAGPSLRSKSQAQSAARRPTCDRTSPP